MLVLTRKVGERIQIGDQITLSVVRVQNGKVRIGIEAPESVKIRRDELNSENLPNENSGSQDSIYSPRRPTILLSYDLPA
jgi:carbon storage regulator